MDRRCINDAWPAYTTLTDRRNAVSSGLPFKFNELWSRNRQSAVLSSNLDSLEDKRSIRRGVNAKSRSRVHNEQGAAAEQNCIVIDLAGIAIHLGSRAKTLSAFSRRAGLQVQRCLMREYTIHSPKEQLFGLIYIRKPRHSVTK